jgi:hypothetical protein
MDHLFKMMSEFAAANPGCWRAVDSVRDQRDKLPPWPDYCFLPMGAAIALQKAAGKTMYEQLVSGEGHSALFAPFAAWRVTQFIYRFDQTLLDELWETPVNEIPPEIFRRLPAWCVYIEVPKSPFRGLFACLEHNVVLHRDELVLIFDYPNARLSDLQIMALHLDEPDVMAAVDGALMESTKEAQRLGIGIDLTLTADFILAIPKMVSLVLYLCSVNAEYTQPALPTGKHTKNGLRFFPPSRPKFIDVGLRIGAALKRGRQSMGSDETSEQTGSSRRPHVRRAHWHSYWIGPKTDQEAIAKWLPPIFVNIDMGEIETTIHAVSD